MAMASGKVQLESCVQLLLTAAFPACPAFSLSLSLAAGTELSSAQCGPFGLSMACKRANWLNCWPANCLAQLGVELWHMACLKLR